jgi:hypothetical protein
VESALIGVEGHRAAVRLPFDRRMSFAAGTGGCSSYLIKRRP